MNAPAQNYLGTHRHIALVEQYAHAQSALAFRKISQQEFDVAIDAIRQQCGALGHLMHASPYSEEVICIVCSMGRKTS